MSQPIGKNRYFSLNFQEIGRPPGRPVISFRYGRSEGFQPLVVRAFLDVGEERRAEIPFTRIGQHRE